MTILDAVQTVEDYDGDEERLIEAVQLLVDTGLAWSLQGFYGRLATSLIEAQLVVDTRSVVLVD